MKITVTLTFAALLAGCAAPGVGTIKPLGDQALSVPIVPGVTTSAQLSASFGSAAVTSFDSGYQVWVYKDQRGAPPLLRLVPVIGLGAGLIPERHRELVVLIGPDGVVRKSRLVVLQPAQP
jgi:hypothetical protein